MQSIVTFHGVTYELPNGRTILKDINFSLSTQLTALVGPNGIGKTCLAELMVGQRSPTHGTIRRHQAMALFPQRETPPPMTVEELLAESYEWSALGEKLLEGIDRLTSCSDLSAGQWMRVRLAIITKNQFLILDEPTNGLDQVAKEVLKSFLEDYKWGVLLISHDRDLLNLCEEVLEFSNQGISKYGGDWDSYEQQRESARGRAMVALDRAKQERDLANFERSAQMAQQQKKNRQGLKSARKGGMPKILLGARKHQAQRTTGRIDADTHERAKLKVSAAFQAYSELKVDPVMYTELLGRGIPSQKLVAEARKFNVHRDRWVFRQDLNFCWRGNTRVALKGPNGSGKSTLLRAILGDSLRSKGEFRTGSLNTVFVDQSGSGLNESQSILENVQTFSAKSEAEIRNDLAKFLFFKDQVFQQVATLSGGERLRTRLACSLLSVETPEMIILDEPTNNLDLFNIRFLENLISQFEGALIVVSHDQAFLRACRMTEEFSVY